MRLQSPQQGLATGKKPEPCILVICGASGDLARTTLVPSLYALHCRKLLPDTYAIVGFSNARWDHATFRAEMREYTRDHSLFDEQGWQEFAEGLHYIHGDFSAPASEDYTALRDVLLDLKRKRGLPDNVLFHLSTPPRFYSEIVHKLGEVGLHRGEGWRRFIVEKPFGSDRESARELHRQLLEVIDEQQLYRIDHFLGKETVQNMLVFRFANPGYEPIWNRQYIDHVQITAAEAEGIGTRAGYYEENGVVRDMVQNHLLHLLCVTAMEQPVAYDGISLRNETFKVLQSIRPLDVERDCVLGQYGEGKSEGENVPSYRKEENVADDSITPTYAALRLELDNWRWSGVPFYLRTGKRLPRKLTEIRIQFKPTPHGMFPSDHTVQRQSMTLTFRLSPDEGILHTFLAKQPGPDIKLQPVTMDFRYDEGFGLEDLPKAYEWLLHDALLGDPTLFPRGDWIDRAWSVVDPVMAHWNTQPGRVPNYDAGTWGPEKAKQLMEQNGRQWINE